MSRQRRSKEEAEEEEEQHDKELDRYGALGFTRFMRVIARVS